MKFGIDGGMFVFEFVIVNIKVGDIVKFVNNKLVFYNVVFEGYDEYSYFDFVFNFGEFWEEIFVIVGIYDFYCEFYCGVGMVGKVVVE